MSNPNQGSIMASPATPTQELGKLSSVDDTPCLHPAPRAPPDAYNRMMTILVQEGNRKKKFQMHRGVLCFYSGYLNAMLNGGFSESGRNFLKLTDVAIDTFQSFYDWMNTGVITVDCGDQYLSPEQILNIYFFADFYQVQALRNKVLELFFQFVMKTGLVPSLASGLIYNKTPTGSPLRRLFVDFHVEAYGFEDWRESLEFWSKEFLADILDGFRDKVIAPGNNTPFERLGRDGWVQEKKRHFCERYHEHAEKASAQKPTTSA